MTLIARIFSVSIVLIVGLLIILNSFPILALAASSNELKVSGWIPYWRDAQGMSDAKKNINKLDTINPFVFIAQPDGTIKDMGKLSDSDWKSSIRYAKQKKVEVIPTVMWSDGVAINAVLSSSTARTAHINAIYDMVKKGGYDGVDIDYESKLSTTIDFYSMFLKELKAKLEKKILTCTVEPRTPPESLYKVVPSNLEYANDYKAIGEYCDRVEIMAYDQQRADILLDEARSGEPYMPLSDIDWVEKVVQLALKDIPAEKIMLGVPTYGHHYQVMVAPNWYKEYQRIDSLNMPDSLALAKSYKVTPGTNKGGEQSFTYFPETSVFKILTSLPVPVGTQRGYEAASQALLFANATGQLVPFDLVWYSDASAVKSKIELAKKYDLRGIALFKIDGQEDATIWKLFN